MFDKPFSPLLPDPEGARMYGNVSNRLEVNAFGRSRLMPVAVPTELFTYMREVAKVPVETEVSLVIDEDDSDPDNTWYVFSLVVGAEFHDLWAYSQASLPKWLMNPAYALSRG